MNIINYGKLKPSLDVILQGYVLGEKVSNYLISNYGVSDIDFSNIFNQLGFISNYLDNDVSNKLVLDLGCGSKSYNPENLGTRTFEPCLCRSLKYLNANPIGVDIGDLNLSLFIILI